MEADIQAQAEIHRNESESLATRARGEFIQLQNEHHHLLLRAEKAESEVYALRGELRRINDEMKVLLEEVDNHRNWASALHLRASRNAVQLQAEQQRALARAEKAESEVHVLRGDLRHMNEDMSSLRQQAEKHRIEATSIQNHARREVNRLQDELQRTLALADNNAYRLASYAKSWAICQQPCILWSSNARACKLANMLPGKKSLVVEVLQPMCHLRKPPGRPRWCHLASQFRCNFVARTSIATSVATQRNGNRDGAIG